MEKLNLIFKLSFKFLNKYSKDYIRTMIKPICTGVLGVLFIPLCAVHPIFAFFALFITIPAFCFAFWKGYVITYSLNYQAFAFFKKQEQKTFDYYVDLAYKNEGKLIKFVTFMAIVTIIGFLPTINIFLKSFSIQNMLINPMEMMSNLAPVMKMSVINTILLAPFINFALQAFFFEKDESYIKLFLNCYRYLDLTGILITLIAVGLSGILSMCLPILYLLLFLPMNVIIYSLNTFWYYSRLKKAN